MENTLFIVFFSSIIYIFRICFFFVGFLLEIKKTKKFREKNYEPYVSVIIPARNEEENILNTLFSFRNIDYPINKYEIIVVNDRSTDRTRNKIEEIISQIPNLKLLNIENDKQKFDIPGKAGTIHFGVQNAKGEIIMITDADCKVQSKWIKEMSKTYYDQQAGFVTSFTYVTGNRIFDKIQAIEWTYMHTMAMGGVGMNQPLGCYGNNLTFRKKFYQDFGGYKTIPFTVTEDLSLQMAFHKQNYKVHYLISPETLVDTKPCKNFKEYLSQHHRWARGGLNLGWRAVIFVLSSFAIWAGLIYFATQGDILNMLFLGLIRMLGDTILLIPPLKILKKSNVFLYLPIAVPFFLLMELIIPFSTLKRKVVWKNQVFTST